MSEQMRVAVLTISDMGSAGEREDVSGPKTAELIESRGYQVVEQIILPDEMGQIKDALRRLSDDEQVDLILTTGGTGFSPRDVTPEATEAVIDRRADNLAQMMRQVSMKITPLAGISRGIAGLRKKTLIINLPGSPKGAVENLEAVLPVLDHALRTMRGERLH